MANTYTTVNGVNQNSIVPELFGDLVRDKIAKAVKVAPLADNLGVLSGEVGETVNFPKWAYIGDASDIAPGTAMTTTQMRQTMSPATIKMVAAPGIEVYDYDNMTALGRAIDEGASQQGIAIARKLDADLIADALTTPFKKQLATVNTITNDELLSAMELYGDDRDTQEFAAIVCHSSYATSFFKMDSFIKTDITHVDGANGTITNGEIGRWMGIPVVLSDRLYDSANQEGILLIVKKGSLAYMPKENPFAETERVASKRLTNVYCSQVYATKLVKDDGIVRCQTVVGA